MDNYEKIPETPIADTAAGKGRKLRPVLIIAGGVLLVIFAALILYLNSSCYKYDKAEDLLLAGKYEDAVVAFTDLGDYKDSAAKITECHRRILFDYLVKQNGYSLNDTGYTYKMSADGDKISLLLNIPEYTVEFRLLIDMKSDTGKFCCEFFPFDHIATTSEGTCRISELTSSENNLTIDSTSGHYDSDQMKSVADPLSTLLCKLLDTTLDKLDAGVTAGNIGFKNID